MSRIQNIPSVLAAALAALALVASGCKSKSEDNKQSGFSESKEEAPDKTSASPPESPAMAAEYMEEAEMDEAGAAGDDMAFGAMDGEAAPKRAKRQGAPGGAVGGMEARAETGPAPRAWFPETFLFRPLVVTDESGAATVEVKVPDRLTTWRVLGLAHSRGGAQAGGTATFEGTLPAYVDPVLPSFLRAGDSVRVPIQLVNNTDASMSTRLNVEVEGGILKGTAQPVVIGKRSSVVRYVEIQTERAGNLRLMARMGESDMVVRDIEVKPVGKPVSQSRSGTLAAPRELSIAGSQAVGASAGNARLSVFPGALALLRSELSASPYRGGLASDAFALLLAGKAPELLKKLGDEADPEALRKLTITSTQKVMKHARVLNVESAALIAEAARSHTGNPVLERLGERAIQTIESAQAPDGTCGGQNGWTLQRLLVATAECARAAHDAPNVTIRARGAFERNAKEIADPYTAAAILAADGASGALKESLVSIVLEAIEERDNGAKVLALPKGVLRTDGRVPSVVEATALAVLALREVEGAPLADLGASLLASYAPSRGWGDGRANLVCMEAAVELFDEPLPETVTIHLHKDGVQIAEGLLERDKVRDVLQLKVEDLDIAGPHEWKVSATPSVPGLGFSLALTSWVPWSKEESFGTELQIELPKTISVGKATSLSIQALAPSAQPFTIELELPAGVQLDTSSLDQMVAASTLQRYEAADGQLRLYVAGLQPGKRFSGSLRVIPTLGGSLASGPTAMRIGNQVVHVPPSSWQVR